jgi:hypothetical protein
MSVRNIHYNTNTHVSNIILCSGGGCLYIIYVFLITRNIRCRKMRYYIRWRRWCAVTRVPKEAHLAAGTGYCLTGLSGFGARFPVARLQQQPPNAPSAATTTDAAHYPAVEVTGSPGSGASAPVYITHIILLYNSTRKGASCKRWLYHDNDGYMVMMMMTTMTTVRLIIIEAHARAAYLYNIICIYTRRLL